MARLPTDAELGKPNLSGGGSGAPNLRTPSTSGANVVGQGIRAFAEGQQDYARGVASFGRSIAGLSQDINQINNAIYQRRQQDAGIAALKADAQAAKSKMELEREFDNDNDYQTWGDRYEEKARKIDSEAGALIPDPVLREKWSIRAGLESAEGKNRLQINAQKRDQDTKRLELVTALESYRSIYLEEKADDTARTKAKADMESAIAIGQKTGLISAENAITLRERFVSASAKEWAETLYESNPNKLYEESQGIAPFERWLKQSESSGRPDVVNKQGYAGLYQFGAPRLLDLGMYSLGKGESINKGKWGGEKWSGTFNIPGFPEVKTLDDFRANPEAQRAAFLAHVEKMDDEIEKNGFEQYEGSIIGGVPITREGLYASMHLSGVGGTRDMLAGGDSPPDAFGSSAREYALKASSLNQFNDLDPADRAKIRAKAVRGSKVNDLLIGIETGTMGEAEVVEAQQEGWLNDYTDFHKVQTALTRKEKEISFASGAAALQDPFKVWDPTETADKKLLDAVVQKNNGAERLAQMDQTFMDDAVLPLFRRTNMVPRDVRGAFEAMTRSSDVGKVMFALSNMDKIERENPDAFNRDMGSDNLRKVVRYREQLAYRKPEEIVETMRLSEDPSRAAAREAAKKEAQKISANIDDGEITDHFDLGAFYSEPGKPAEPLTSGEMRADFDRLFAEEYAVLGDAEAAKKAALKLMEGVWNVTDTTGERQLMKYPPERYYAPINGSHEWMQEQAKTELAPHVGGDAFVLRSDATTDAEIKSGTRPSYLVIRKNADGYFEAVTNRQTGKMVRFYFDAKPYTEKAATEKQRKLDEFEARHQKAKLEKSMSEIVPGL